MEDRVYNKVTAFQNLKEAWQTVKTKGSSGGVDEVSVKMFDQHALDHLQVLQKELVQHKYVPEPYKHIDIKKGKSETRPIGLMTVRDKIVQVAVKNVIEPHFEKGFLPCSFAYRPGKNTLRAVKQVSYFIQKENRRWIAVCDIDNFFDTIPHELLLGKLEKKIRSPGIMHLIRYWVKMGEVDHAKAWADRKAGVPQGAILSPLLSNFYLHPLDSIMMKNRVGFVRYADDFVMLSRRKADAQRAASTANYYLTKKLGLKLNSPPSVKPITEGFQFLGISFKNNDVFIDQEKRELLLNALGKEIYLDKQGNLNTLFFTIFDNIRNYYGKILPEAELENMDREFLQIVADRFFVARKDKIITSKTHFNRLLSSFDHFSYRFTSERVLLSKAIISQCEEAIKQSLQKFPELEIPIPEQPESYKNDSDDNPTEPESAEKIVARKKREYQKLESAGMELVVSTPGVFAGISKNRIVLKKKGRVIHSLPYLNLKNISVISGGVALSSNLIEFCSKHQIAIHFLNYNGAPYAQLISPAFIRAKTGLAQLESLENNIAPEFIKASITGKMKNQINLLKYYNKYRKNTDPDFARQFNLQIIALQKLQAKIKMLPFQDLGQYRKSVFAIEGQTAAIYWAMIKTLLDDDVDFPGRLHQDASDIVNVLLNYGYGMLYSRIWQAILGAGLNPYISYLHSSERNKPGLVFDFIEEFRQQAVDRVVIAFITKGETYEMKNGRLSDNTRKRIAQKVLERLNNVEKFRNTETRLSEIIRMQANNLHKRITGKIKTYKPYIAKW